ncbi:MAG: hypothetical protein DRI71_05040 [Bacteroidetes bacterium]|nr:MAG: hypothetical protein DRI71_05040 [Bacteroidota bacterium]
MKKYLVLGGIIILAGVVINYSLGGFKPIEPGLISSNGITLYGWTYEGSHSSDALDSQIEALRSIIKDSDQQGILTVVNYIQPQLEKRGVVKQFIGIEWVEGNNAVPDNLDSLVIEPYNGIQFVIPIKPLVMPSPEKLKALALESAMKMDTELSDISIEQYKDKSLVLNFPLK